MPVTTQPHSSWAEVYDLAYERSFGEFYRKLTDATIQAIENSVQPPARIVDFGAGTGRLSIPLAEKGFDVTAVEPCLEMLEQLEQKKQQTNLRTVCSKMEDFKTDEKFDIALCVFTVLLYLLDEASLTKALTGAYASLKPGGILLIDIPLKTVFQGYSNSDHMIERSVSIASEADNIFTYKEELQVKHESGDEVRYSDTFKIRYWPEKQVRKVLADTGFILEADLSGSIYGAGSHYY